MFALRPMVPARRTFFCQEDEPITAGRVRSEEHTSELQSRQYLVCRLLLEKKSKTLPLFAFPANDQWPIFNHFDHNPEYTTATFITVTAFLLASHLTLQHHPVSPLSRCLHP